MIAWALQVQGLDYKVVTSTRNVKVERYACSQAVIVCLTV